MNKKIIGIIAVAVLVIGMTSMSFANSFMSERPGMMYNAFKEGNFKNLDPKRAEELSKVFNELEEKDFESMEDFMNNMSDEEFNDMLNNMRESGRGMHGMGRGYRMGRMGGYCHGYNYNR